MDSIGVHYKYHLCAILAPLLKDSNFTILGKRGFVIPRKTVAILLLSCFLMNAIGYVGLYALMRWHIVHEISELIERHDSEDYSELILSKKQIDSADGQFTRINKHEFRYKGKMYDIVSQNKIGDSIRYTVIHDRKDELNFDRLATNTNLQDQSSADSPAHKSALLDTMVKNLYAPLFFQVTRRYNIKTFSSIISAIQLQNLPDTPFLQVPVPPPKSHLII